MKNGLYSIHMNMLDGVKGRDSGVLILRDGVLLGGGPHFWSIGSYTVGNGTWKGELSTDQHTGFADPFVRPLFARRRGLERLYRDLYRRRRGGVRHRPGRSTQPQLPRDVKAACRCLMPIASAPVDTVDRCAASAGGGKEIRDAYAVGLLRTSQARLWKGQRFSSRFRITLFS